MHRSRECTPSDLSTGISNLLQPAQAEVVLGQLSTDLASWVLIVRWRWKLQRFGHNTAYAQSCSAVILGVRQLLMREITMYIMYCTLSTVFT